MIAFDHRGHGTGLRSKKPFRLEDCADDAVDIAAALGVERFIPVGYSMGGPIAQLMWRRHPDNVVGLVLCATAPYFAGRREKRLGMMGLTGLAAVARVTPEQTEDLAHRAALPAAHAPRSGSRGRSARPPTTTGGRSSRPARRSAGSPRRSGSARSTCPRRRSSRCATRSSRCGARSSCSNRSPTPRRSGSTGCTMPSSRTPTGSPRR